MTYAPKFFNPVKPSMTSPQYLTSSPLATSASSLIDELRGTFGLASYLSKEWAAVGGGG